MTEEIWRAIPDAPGYEVSNLGRVRSVRVTYLRPDEDKRKGHLYVRLYVKKSEPKKFAIHRLVAAAFIGPPPSSEHQALHRDGNPKHNTDKNLRWGTNLENMADRRLHGRELHGERCPSAKLTEQDVIAIRSSEKSNGELAAQYGVTTSHIRRLKDGRHWKCIGESNVNDAA